MKKLMTLILAMLVLFAAAMPALAVDFTPSAESKHLSVSNIIGEDGKAHDAILHDKDGNVVGYIDNDGEDDRKLVLTNPDEQDDRIPGIQKLMDEGEKELKECEDLGELCPGLKVEMEQRKKDSDDPIYKTFETEDLIVSAFFDLSLVLNGEVIEQIPDGQTIQFCIQTNFRPGDVFFIVVNCDGEGWVLVDSWEIDENGVVTITASQLCVLAFVVPDMTGSSGGGGGEGAPKSPQTGYADWTWAILAGAAVVVGSASLAGFGLLSSKKR